MRTYGAERGGRVRLIEAFEVSEYGAPLDADARARLFPFLPAAIRLARRSPGRIGSISPTVTRALPRQHDWSPNG